MNLLPDDIKQAPDNTTFTDNIIKEGNALPLLTLIPAIFAGISALTSLAGNKQANEEHIAAQGRTMSDRDKPVERTMSVERVMPVEKRTMSDDELINKSIEFLTGKGFSVSI